MANKVYYGEYTLKHWVDLILTGDIVLPEYQRYFVWDKEKSKSLINAIADNQFVPPVTIGSYLETGKKLNLILDGQQRLTSILLSYLNLFPKKEQNKVTVKELYFASENDDQEEDDETDFINWNFNQLLKMIKEKGLRNKSEIHDYAISVGYENMDISIGMGNYEKCYLGFSFIVPETEDSKEQQKFYSKVFRSINIEGKKLLPLESREALYYLNKDLVGLFSPEFAKNICINEGKMDFVRYLAMISQFQKNGLDKIARGYTKTMEIYYENFIYAVVDGKATEEFINLSDKIQDLEYQARMKVLETIVSEMELVKLFDSIIVADMYMFGLIYHIIFEDKKIECDKYDEYKQKIQDIISSMKADKRHYKNPSALKHLKIRIDKSITTCGEFVS